MKILYTIGILGYGGASHALLNLSENYICDIANIYCTSNERDKSLKINTGNGCELYKYYLKNKFDLIHFFKSEDSQIFDELVIEMKKNKQYFPIIITHCQYPSNLQLTLTTNELLYSTKIVFIANEFIKNTYFKYLPKELIKLIYFGTHIELSPDFKRKPNNLITFGRGSTLNKCHPETINWYSSINCKAKMFQIAGDGDNSKLNDEVIKFGLKKSVNFLGRLSFKSWINFLQEIDIFLYQLPLDCYSAVDYTMQHAMLMKLPIVYYGPNAPKELIEHGVSGFIANNKKEFIYYSELLANDEGLRKRIGKNANEKILSKFSLKKTIQDYSMVYKNVIGNNDKAKKIPLTFFIHYYWKHYHELGKKKILSEIFKIIQCYT